MGTFRAPGNLTSVRDKTFLDTAACSCPERTLQSTWQEVSWFPCEESAHSLLQLNPPEVTKHGRKLSAQYAAVPQSPHFSPSRVYVRISFSCFYLSRACSITLERNKEGRQEIGQTRTMYKGTMCKGNCFGRTDKGAGVGGLGEWGRPPGGPRAGSAGQSLEWKPVDFPNGIFIAFEILSAKMHDKHNSV